MSGVREGGGEQGVTAEDCSPEVGFGKLQFD